MRTKQFVREEALDKAVELFWQQGYEATSIQNLVDKMGINRSSMYDTFGDKQQLFLVAMERYIDRVVSKRLAVVNTTGSGKESIQQFFGDVVDYAVSDAERRG